MHALGEEALNYIACWDALHCDDSSMKHTCTHEAISRSKLNFVHHRQSLLRALLTYILMIISFLTLKGSKHYDDAAMSCICSRARTPQKYQNKKKYTVVLLCSAGEKNATTTLIFQPISVHHEKQKRVNLFEIYYFFRRRRRR